MLRFHWATGTVSVVINKQKRNTTMKKRMKKGFTLVEIMIVVAIIAILAAIAIPNFVKYRKESQQATCEQTRAQIVTAAENWGSKTANASATTVDLTTLAPTDGSGYFKNVPKCPSGGTYTITKNQTSGAWECVCSEADHKVAADAGTETPAGG